MTFTKAELTRIIESADEVITALAGTNDDIHPDNSTKMCAAWDDLNDRNAPPSVVKKLAEMALAGMEAEPVYFINRVKHSDAYGDDVELRTYCYELDALKSKDDFGGEVVPVYTAPQPLTTSERAELENYRNAQQVVPDCFLNSVVALESLYRNGQKQNWNERYTTDMAYASGVINACRAAMLQGKAEPVTTACKLPVNTPCKEAPEHIWLQTAGIWPENGEFGELTWCSDNQHADDTLYVRADVVAGNSPVIPDGWVACSDRIPNDKDYVWCWGVYDDLTEADGFEGYYDASRGKWWASNNGDYVDGGFGGEYKATVTHWMLLPAAPQQEAQ